MTLTPIVFATSLVSSPPIQIERRRNLDSSFSWAVVRGSATLNIDGDWEYEPYPSQRDELYLARNRHTFDDAQALLQKWLDQEVREVR